MRTTKGRLALTGAGLAAALTLGACGGGSEGSGSMGGMTGHGSTTSAPAGSGTSAPDSRAGDVMFAQMMIPHHEQAIEMADVALQKASASQEVRELAEQVKAAQGPEIAIMNEWLSTWGAPASAPMDHGAGGMMSDEDMSALRAAEGPAFDRRWLTMMIAHHQGAVAMAKDVLSTTQDAEVKGLAQAVVEGQQKEITAMQRLLG